MINNYEILPMSKTHIWMHRNEISIRACYKFITCGIIVVSLLQICIKFSVFMFVRFEKYTLDLWNEKRAQIYLYIASGFGTTWQKENYDRVFILCELFCVNYFFKKQFTLVNKKRLYWIRHNYSMVLYWVWVHCLFSINVSLRFHFQLDKTKPLQTNSKLSNGIMLLQ